MSQELISFEDTPDYSLPELSKDVLNLFDSLSKKRQAVTFDVKKEFFSYFRISFCCI